MSAAHHHVERSRQRRSSRARAARAHRVRAQLQHLRPEARRRWRRRAGASPRGTRPLDIHGRRAVFSFRVPPVGPASSPRAQRLTPPSPHFSFVGLHPRGEDVRRRRGECACEPRRRAANDATDPTKPVASLPPSFAHPHPPLVPPPIRRPRAAPSSSAPLAPPSSSSVATFPSTRASSSSVRRARDRRVCNLQPRFQCILIVLTSSSPCASRPRHVASFLARARERRAPARRLSHPSRRNPSSSRPRTPRPNLISLLNLFDGLQLCCRRHF